MGLSKNDSDILWQAVQDRKFLLSSSISLLASQKEWYTYLRVLDNLARFNTINNKLLNPPGTPLRNIPIKIYLPITSPTPSSGAETEEGIVQASVRTVQGLIAPVSETRKFSIFPLLITSRFSMRYMLIVFLHRSNKYIGYGVK
jgi:autophagy-related protein 5